MVHDDRAYDAELHLKKWRIGRKNPFTIYALLGETASDFDPYVGSLRTQEASEAAVRGHNRNLRQNPAQVT